jgi:hypothetical protein
MTRAVTVSQMKGTGHPKTDGRPAAGSVLREYYDAFRRGEVLVTSPQRNILRVLRDEYGMEFNTIRGSKGCSKLIGEWEGLVFVKLEEILQED